MEMSLILTRTYFEYIFFFKHIFLQVPPNMFHITHSRSERIYTTDFVLVLFDRYWTILHTRFSFIPIGSAVCPYEDFSHYSQDNLCTYMD